MKFIAFFIAYISFVNTIHSQFGVGIETGLNYRNTTHGIQVRNAEGITIEPGVPYKPTFFYRFNGELEFGKTRFILSSTLLGNYITRYIISDLTQSPIGPVIKSFSLGGKSFDVTVGTNYSIFHLNEIDIRIGISSGILFFNKNDNRDFSNLGTGSERIQLIASELDSLAHRNLFILRPNLELVYKFFFLRASYTHTFDRSVLQKIGNLSPGSFVEGAIYLEKYVQFSLGAAYHL